MEKVGYYDLWCFSWYDRDSLAHMILLLDMVCNGEPNLVMNVLFGIHYTVLLLS